MFGHLKGEGGGPRGRVAPSGKRSPKWHPRVEQLEDRLAPAATPVATLVNVPTQALIGDPLSFTVRFDNTSPTDVGYGPYVDLFLPATGIDGRVSAPNDGITFVGATYLGAPVQATVLTLTAAGVVHPFAKDGNGNPIVITPPAGYFPGDQLVVLQVPYGSFTPNQPVADLLVSATLSNLADVNAPLPIAARGGFRFGNDALDNPTSDPTVLGPTATAPVEPTLFTLTKTYIGPEDETTTGPDFPRQYQISVDVANGQTLTNLDLTDVLPPELQFVSVVSTTPAATATATPSTTTPGGTLTRTFASVTGTAGTVDAQMTFSFYVPRGTVGAPILDPTTGDDATAVDDAKAAATWDPIDPRDPLTPVTSDVTTNDHTLTLKSIATQKTSTIVNDVGAPGLSPGDTVQYTINFQVSDYFAFQNIVLTDLFSDGQNYVPGSATYSIADGHTPGGSITGTFLAPNAPLTPNITGGSDQLLFLVSQELAARGFSPSGRLVGGAIPAGGTGVGPPPATPAPFGATQGTITFRTVVQDRYAIDFPSGDPALDQGDPITNAVTISGDLLNVTDLTPNGNSEDDDSSAALKVVSGTFNKTVYAINGVVGNYSSSALIAPGDTVTYRLVFTLPTGDAENLVLRDFLPLPIFDVDTTGAVTAFDSVVSAAVPAAGRAKFGPTDTYRALSGIVPALSLDPLANGVIFNYGTYDDPTNTPVTIDILFTVTVSSDPFADQLLLSNGAQVTTSNTAQQTGGGESIAQVTLGEPALNITKGVVATNNPAGVFSPGTVGPVAFNAPGTTGPRFTGTINSAGLDANPINSNLSNIDQDDLVTFAVVVENTGSGPKGAFDVVLRDTLPEGLFAQIGGGPSAINLRVTDGAGNPIAFELVEGASGGILGAIRLIDPSTSRGAIGPGSVNGVPVQDGSNIVIVTFDLRTSGNRVNQIITDVASVTNYAGSEGGPDFTAVDLTDDAKVQIATPKMTKELVSTEIVNTTNANNEAVIGELVTYRVRVTVPEGTTPGAVLTDTLDPELAFVGMVSSTVPGLVTVPGGLAPTSVTNNGRTITWNLGDIVNNNSSNAVPEVIELVYTAVVVNTAESNANDQVNNSARFTYQGGNPVQAAAPNVTIIEPQVKIDKSVSVAGGDNTGDAGDPFVYTIVLSNPPGANAFTADAFDLTFRDLLQAGLLSSPLNITGFTVIDTAGQVSNAQFELVTDPGTGRLVLQTKAGVTFDMLVNATRTITIQVSGTVAETVVPGEVIPNDAEVRWTSLDGNPGQRSTFSPDSTERTGAGGVNDYVADDDADIDIINAELFKTVVSTSENATTDPGAVVVGEIVRYRVVMAIPEFGTPTSFQMLDLLPVGMQFVADGNGRIAFVTDAGDNLISTAYPPAPGLYLTGDENNVATLVPGFPVSPSTFTIDIDPGTGRPRITLNLGLLTNPASPDDDFEFAIVEFNAVVTDVASNQAGTELVNDASTVVGGVPSGEAASVAVHVAEPSITDLTKQVVRAGGLPVSQLTPDVTAHDAGDLIHYAVSYSNSAVADTSTAYDVRLVDALPTAKMALNPGSVRVFRNDVEITTGFTNNTSGNTVDVSVDVVAPGDVITVFYDVTLTSGVIAGETVPNTANLTYTSVPGPNGTASNPTGSVTPGAPGTVTGERTGADGVGGALNDYADTASASVPILAPQLDKNILDTGIGETGSDQFDPNLVDLTIGETVTYRLTITVPEGTSTLTLTDLLPTMNQGTVVFQSARVAGIGRNISGSLLAVGAPPSMVSGDTITFNFGTVVNLGDNVVNEFDQITVDVIGTVTDLPENVAGAQVTNTATLDYGFGTVPDDAVADIVEPVLDIQKDVAPTTADAGDVVTYTVIVSHLPTSTAPAFQVVITDPLNAGNLQLIPGSVTVTGSPGAAVATGNTPGDTTITITDAVLLLGESLTITYKARLTASPAPGDVVPNTATLDSTSVPPGFSGRPATDNDPAQVTVNSSSISGVIYTDLNDNGIYEPLAGEMLITTPVTMQLTGTDHLGNAVSMTLITMTGTYLFTGLRPGNYVVTEVNQPTGLADGRDTPGTPFGGTGTLGAIPRDADAISGIAIPLGSNTAGVDYNFGELPPATIGNFVWDDLDGNGQQDPLEPGLDNVGVSLVGTNPDGTRFSLTTATDSNGLYSFTGLRPGSYFVIFGTRLGFVFTLRNAPGVPDNLNSVADRSSGESLLTPLGIGETNTRFDAGMILAASVSGFVYRDFNINGLREPGATNPETGIGGVRLVLTGVDPLGNPLLPRTTTTNPDGSYLFDLLPQGTYTITEIQPPTVFAAGPAGFYDGLDTPGTVGGTARGTVPTKNAIRVALGIDEDGVDYNFGELTPADPFGFVYVDQNQNGIRDPGEPGIAGVAITISGTAFAGSVLARPLVGADLPGGSLTTLTDANGFWRFPLMPPGTYAISESQPAGYLDGLEQNGDPGLPAPIVGNDVFAEILLSPFPVRGPFNFGEILPVRPLSPLPPLVPPGIDKSMFLSSTPAVASVSSGPQYVNSVAKLGVASPITSIGVAVGTDAGQPGLARLFDFRTATERVAVNPYPGFAGGIRVAVGDIDGDGIDDLVTAPGPGLPPSITAYSGATGQLLGVILAYAPGFIGGTNIAVGDIDGDGHADIVVSLDAGFLPVVEVFSGATGQMIRAFLAYPPDYSGGLRVAVGDVNGDGFADIVTIMDRGSLIGVFDGRTQANLAYFYAFQPSFMGVVNVTIADMNGDGIGEIVATATTGFGSFLSATDLGGPTAYTYLPLALSPNLGLRVAGADINGDGATDLVFSTPAWSEVFIMSGRSITTPLDDFYAFGLPRIGGVFVG